MRNLKKTEKSRSKSAKTRTSTLGDETSKTVFWIKLQIYMTRIALAFQIKIQQK